MNLALLHPSALWLLPLAVIPLVFHGQTTATYSSLAMLPDDALSRIVALGLRFSGFAAALGLVLGIAGLHRTEQPVERIGAGAQMVILIDSSGSMDRPFATGNEQSSRAGVWGTYTSKGQIARRLLADYAAKRPQDMFALFLFSGNPIAVHPLTEKQEVIQAAIAAGTIERGLASTDLGKGLIQSLEFFRDKPFTGSRILMLVSDGAAKLTQPVKERIRQLLEVHRVTLYWMYLRDQHSPGLHTAMTADTAEAIAPEQLVHRFFSEMKLPYRAYSAENPEALQDAIAEVNQLQNLPIRYTDVIPKRDLSGWCFGAAFALLLVVLAARFAERRLWR